MSTQTNFISKVRNDIEVLQTKKTQDTKEIGRILAEQFIKVRMQNSLNLESSKSRAIELLSSKLDHDCSVEQLSKIIDILSSISGSDIDRVISLLPYVDNKNHSGNEVKVISNLLNMLRIS